MKEASKTPTKESINWTRVTNDINGNPRYVCHFLNFISRSENAGVSDLYELALKRAKKIGGKKFHNRQYGGGIVFQSYNLADTERSIHDLVKSL